MSKKNQYQLACSLARRAQRKQNKVKNLVAWCAKKTILANIRLAIADKLAMSQMLDLLIPAAQPWKKKGI